MAISQYTFPTNTGVLQTGVTTTAKLPAATAALKGARYFVTDATSTTFAAAPTGGGTDLVPVYCDGSGWKIG